MNAYMVCQDCRVDYYEDSPYLKGDDKCPHCGKPLIKVSRDAVPILSPLLFRGYRVSKIDIDFFTEFEYFDVVDCMDGPRIVFPYVDPETFKSVPYFNIKSSRYKDPVDPELFKMFQKLNEGKRYVITLKRKLGLKYSWDLHTYFRVKVDFDNKPVGISPCVIISNNIDMKDWKSDIWYDEAKIKEMLFVNLLRVLDQNLVDHYLDTVDLMYYGEPEIRYDINKKEN